MQLFISYARVDKRYCQQIVNLLDMHDIWYDQRLYAGQRWWEEIVNRLEQCQGFVYLLSPESIASEYCQKEFAVARSLGKHVFPILIHPRTKIPDTVKEYQCADLSNGLDADSVKTLLSAIFLAERTTTQSVYRTTTVPVVKLHENSSHDYSTLIAQAAEAIESESFDQALFLLKQVQSGNFTSRFIDLTSMIHEVEEALEHQAYLREAEREYAPIVALAKRDRTRKISREAFKAFSKAFPDYDPENLARVLEESPLATQQVAMSFWEWCDVIGGKLILEHGKERKVCRLEPFQMTKYPVTNIQFQAFIDAHNGYSNDAWWNFSPYALAWHRSNPSALNAKYQEEDIPRGNVCWYEVMAYCNWASHVTGLNITLPTEEQWQWAAQGQDGRMFPWGERFNKKVCNSRESGIKRPTPVTTFREGMSPFGVMDMAGNVWEWCSNGYSGDPGKSEGDSDYRIMRGGSFMSAQEHLRNKAKIVVNPLYRYSSIGFRLVLSPASS